jgi:hypothetical protein
MLGTSSQESAQYGPALPPGSGGKEGENRRVFPFRYFFR